MAIYYVSNTGSNSNAGTSTGAPWQTIAKVNSSSSANDTINFKGGDTFNDATLVLKSSQTVQSYGSGQAKIDGTTGVAISIPLTPSWLIDNLEVTANSDVEAAIMADANLGGSHIAGGTVSNCYIHGPLIGIKFWSDWDVSNFGYSNLQIINNEISFCQDFGIATGGFYAANDNDTTNAHVRFPNVLWSGNNIHDITGGPQNVNGNASGCGICPEYTSGLITLNIVKDCAYLSESSGAAPCGIIPIVSRDLTISYNIVSHFDCFFPEATGIEIDFLTDNIIVEYNYVFDCGGSGIGSIVSTGGTTTFRYNLVLNCGTMNGQSQFYISTVGTVNAYNNTFYEGVGPTYGTPLIKTLGVTGSLNLVNNIFVRRDDYFPILDMTGGNILGIVRNNLWSAGGGFLAHINGTDFTSFSACRSDLTTKFENYGSVLTGIYAQPMFHANFPMPTSTLPSQIAALTDYQLSPTSPANATGVDVEALLSIADDGGHDITGAVLRASFSVGAYDAPNAAAIGYGVGQIKVFHDDFIRPDTSPGTAGNTTAVGNNWTDVTGGVGSISSHRLKLTNAGTGHPVILRPSYDSIVESIITAQVDTMPSVGTFYLMGKYIDSSNYIQNAIVASSDFVANGAVGGSGGGGATASATLAGKVLDLYVNFQGGSSLQMIFSGTNHTDDSSLWGFTTYTPTPAFFVGLPVAFGVDSGTFYVNSIEQVAIHQPFAIASSATTLPKNTTTTITLTGTNTFWNDEPPVFDITGGTITSTTVTSNTSVSVTIAASTDSILITEQYSLYASLFQLTDAVATPNGAAMMAFFS